MKRLIPLTAAVALVFAFVAIRPGFSDDADSKTAPKQPAAAKTAADKQNAPAKKPRKIAGRLPNYFGKIGVSGEQRKQIYAVQATYRKQIGALQKQIADLEAKRDAEIFALLTDTQKDQVTKLREEAKQRAEEKKRKAAQSKTKPAEKTPATKTDK